MDLLLLIITKCGQWGRESKIPKILRTSFGRIVTIFGHPLLNEQRVFLHNGVADRVVHQNLTQKAVEYSCVLIIKDLLQYTWVEEVLTG